jgi:hypothetical protein
MTRVLLRSVIPNATGRCFSSPLLPVKGRPAAPSRDPLPMNLVSHLLGAASWCLSGVRILTFRRHAPRLVLKQWVLLSHDDGETCAKRLGMWAIGKNRGGPPNKSVLRQGKGRMLGFCISPGWDRRNDLNVTRFQVHEFLSGSFNGFVLMRADFNATVKSFCDRRTRFRNSENQSNGVFFEDRRHICGSPCGCGSIAHKTFFQVNRPVSVDALVSHARL